MPSTETRRIKDLITLVRDTVNGAVDNGEWKWIARGIWEVANDTEKAALLEFSKWFNHTDEFYE